MSNFCPFCTCPYISGGNFSGFWFGCHYSLLHSHRVWISESSPSVFSAYTKKRFDHHHHIIILIFILLFSMT